jgi:cytoskeleton protein RodZ
VLEIGKALRSARERQGLERAEVEQRTHIRSRYLAALEDERFDAIPGRAYAQGFLRVYADELGLDATQLIDEFNRRYPETPPEELEPLTPASLGRPRRGGRIAALAIAALAVALVATFAAWRPGGGHRPAAVHERPSAAGAAHTAARAKHRAAAKPATAAPAATAATAHLTLRASGPCWLSVHAGSQSGATLYEGTLAAGGALRYTLAPGRPRIWLRIGAPWALTMALNGKRAGTLLTAPGNVLATRTGLRTT